MPERKWKGRLWKKTMKKLSAELKEKYGKGFDFRIISGNPRQFNYRDESANCAYLHS